MHKGISREMLYQRSTIILAVCTLLLAIPATAQQYEQIHTKHIIYGTPTGTPPTSDLIIRDSYATSADETTKFADWVAYRLTPEEVWGSLDLTRKWRADPWLDADETLEPSGPDDYKGANSEPLKFDRGHLAPLASFKGTTEASSVNYYSNIMPQAGDLNQGPWKHLEEAVRDFVKRGNVVWAITGPLYETDMDALPNADDRRFWVIEGPSVFNPPEYYNRIYAWSAEARNSAAVYWWLRQYDLRGFNGAARPPLNDAKLLMVAANTNVLEQALEELKAEPSVTHMTKQQVERYLDYTLTYEDQNSYGRIDDKLKRMARPWCNPKGQSHRTRYNGAQVRVYVFSADAEDRHCDKDTVHARLDATDEWLASIAPARISG